MCRPGKIAVPMLWQQAVWQWRLWRWPRHSPGWRLKSTPTYAYWLTRWAWSGRLRLGKFAVNGSSPYEGPKFTRLRSSMFLDMKVSGEMKQRTDWPILQISRTVNLWIEVISSAPLESWGAHRTSIIMSPLYYIKKERGVKRGIARNETYRGRIRSIVNQERIGTISRYTLGDLLKRGSEHLWTCPECSDDGSLITHNSYF